MSKKPVSFKIGRDAKNGQFITVQEARSRPTTTVVQHLPRKK